MKVVAAAGGDDHSLAVTGVELCHCWHGPFHGRWQCEAETPPRILEAPFETLHQYPAGHYCGCSVQRLTAFCQTSTHTNPILDSLTQTLSCAIRRTLRAWGFSGGILILSHTSPMHTALWTICSQDSTKVSDMTGQHQLIVAGSCETMTECCCIEDEVWYSLMCGKLLRCCVC